MTHLEKAHQLSNQIFELILPLKHQRLNPGVVAHALIYAAVRLMVACSIKLAPHVNQDAANMAFGELMCEINTAVNNKFRKLGVPIEGMDLGGDVNDPPTNPFFSN